MTAPFLNLPDYVRFSELMKGVFSRGQLTNQGPLVRELESRLADYLDVEFLVLTSSGTLALQIAYRALGLSGSVITTPFSWLTTVSSLCWVGLEPVFVDIDCSTYNINPALIEKAVTTTTSAILPVHAFGNPCDIEAIGMVAKRRGLKVVYDGAHAFGSRYRDRSVFAHGDASILSLHATKLFHAVEGGAVILRDRVHYEAAKAAVNNGVAGDRLRPALGVNGRMSELHAAVGLCLLENIDGVLHHRARMAEMLRTQLLQSSAVELQKFQVDTQTNHCYFPVVCPTHAQREQAVQALTGAGFVPRRYFEPPLNCLPYLKAQLRMPVAESISNRILCLPLSVNATREDVTAMARIVAAQIPMGGPALVVARA